MIDFYQIRSPLSQISEEQMHRFIRLLEQDLGEPMQKVSLEQYLADEFALLYVASGGSEGYFIEVFEQLKSRPCYILTSGESNSLAASMEILSYIRKHGGKGEILHGDTAAIAARVLALRAAYRAKARLQGKKLGCIGAPSDWLIASDYDTAAVQEKLGLGFVSIPMEELLNEIEKKTYEPNDYTEMFLAMNFDRGEIEKALHVYGALKRLCQKYDLCGVSVRCFDLLDTVCTTGCLGLSILNAEGVYGGCEGDMTALLSMAVLGSLTDEPLFLCNPSRFDTKNGTAIFAHCTIPVTMLKGFCLNTHFESGIGVAVQGTFAEGPCTIFKCAGDLSRYHAQEGEIAPVEYSEMLCRTQIKLKLDDFSYFLTKPINNHHIICRGHHAAAAEAFFQII
jgi:L-fucose isomerase-like protein